jgi:hypothetical protein|tara:strand:- start:1246 stop:2040 length:795 start_codon:yes stop_codon:yes gene_type:complete
MIFKNIRSLVGRLFSENMQMHIVMILSNIFWSLRKYFLSVEIKYPQEFVNNWNSIKYNSSQDKERNFTVYQMIKVHNEIFKGKESNAIEFGVDRGGTLSTISRFVKKNTTIYALDSFGIYAEDIKKNVTDFDPHYKGVYKPFTKKTRFKNFSYKDLENNLNDELKEKQIKTKIIPCFFPEIIEKASLEEISNKKYSFVHFDFDLYKPTVAAINFIMSRLEENAILLFDDYNFINQEGVKWAVKDCKIDLNKCVQTQGGQLICHI